MTPTSKPVTRRCTLPSRLARQRRLVITLGPGDMLELRPERSRQSEFVPIDAIYSMAVKMRLLFEKKEKAAIRRAKKEARA
jgi:hypothetical protein